MVVNGYFSRGPLPGGIAMNRGVPSEFNFLHFNPNLLKSWDIKEAFALVLVAVLWLESRVGPAALVCCLEACKRLTDRGCCSIHNVNIINQSLRT